MRNLFLTVILILAFATGMKAQLNADFNVSVLDSCGSGLVSFTDLTTGSPSGWQWDFGDGSASSSLQNPTKFYPNPGVYTITLVATDGTNTDTEVKTGAVTVYIPPTASFTIDTTFGCFPMSANFTNVSTPGDGTIVSALWDFGDGAQSTGNSLPHTYSAAGPFSPSIFVTDDNGCTDQLILVDTMNVQSLPTASFTTPDTLACTPNLVTNVTDASSGSGLTYQWDFGDGSAIETSQTPAAHTYNAFGTFIISLSVTSDVGCTAQDTQAVYLAPFVAGFSTLDSIGCGTLTTSFADTSTIGVSGWQWDFGDGNTSTVQNPTHTYNAPGTYTVSLVSSNSVGCSDSIGKSSHITVHALPNVSFTSTDSIACMLPFDVTFTSQTSGVDSLRWTFGQGGSSVDSVSITQYSAVGDYAVSLAVTDTNGCVDTLTKVDLISIELPITDFVDTVLFEDQLLPFDGCGPLDVTFNETSYANDVVNGWQWDFGDGSSSNLESPTHTYNDTGSYDISITITTAKGCTATRTRLGAVEVGIKPIPGFTQSATVGCVDEPIDFTDTSSTYTDTWFWDFSIGTSTTQHPSQTFMDTGRYDVALTATFKGCDSTVTKPLAVEIVVPKALFTVTPAVLCNAPFTVTITEGSEGADNWNWDFGDLNTSTAQSPGTHTYTTFGQYTLSLSVTNITTGCEHSTQQIINVPERNIGFDQDTAVGCVPLTISFSDTSTTSAGISQYQWDFGDGTVTPFSSGTITGMPNTSGTYNDPVHEYTAPGFYTVTLTVIDNLGCMDVLVSPTQIEVKPLPVPLFSTSTKTGCPGISIDFTDLSTSSGNVTNWKWILESDTFQIQNPTRVYDTVGDFDVQLIVIDEFNCTDTNITNNHIRITKPSTHFTVDTIICDSTTVLFTNNTTGVGLNYVWDFGDGTATDNSQNPSHLFASSSGVSITYVTTLSVTDANGCDSVFSQPITIDIPETNFTIGITTANCPPFAATFVDSSFGDITNWIWDFGDGSTVDQQNPIHTYVVGGFFDVSLRVITANGCTDSVRVDSLIEVGGPNGAFSLDVDSSGCFISVDFASTTQNADIVTWIFDDGAVGIGDSVTHIYYNAGNYFPIMVLEDTTNGCQVNIVNSNGLLVPPPPPVVFFSTVPENCVSSDGTILATPTSGTSPYSYNWDNGATSDLVSGLSQGAYNVTVVDAQGCDSSFTVSLTATFPTITAIHTTTNAICANFDGSATMVSQSGGTSPYSFLWPGGQTGTSVSGLQAGTHNVTITDADGCASIEPITVGFDTSPIDASFSTSPEEIWTETNVVFTDISTATNTITSWEWDFGNGNVDTSQQSSVTQSYEETGTYSVQLVITDSDGCVDSTSLNVTVSSGVIVPRVFTPNGDGINDVFKVVGSGITSYDLSISNRWGQLMFRTTRSGQGWDGRTYAGEEAPSGTYFYILSYTLESGETTDLQGPVSLIR